jgi:hypothetical protein
MNEARRASLLRTLRAPGRAPSQLFAKASAARTLAADGAFKELTPNELVPIRAAFEELLLDAEQSATWQGDRAASVIGGVLDQLDEDEAAKEKPPYEYASWMVPDLDDEDRLRWLRLDLLVTMCHATSVEVNWQKRARADNRKLKPLEREAESILVAADPIQAAQDWLDQHWDPDAVVVAAPASGILA